jgi:predicted NBD/HSP70 family sugar kinase
MAIQDMPFDQDLSRVLARPVRVANDAHCFALSEAVGGAGAGHKVVFGAILGTGVGGGLVVDGKLLVGANAISGEWGHNPLPWPREGENPGPKCDCGRHGCVETFFSGPGLARDHQAVTGKALGSADIAAGAARGEADCVATMERAYDRIARAMGALISIVDPDVIVVGGGVSGIDALYSEVPGRWGAYVLSDHVDTRLVKHRFGDSSGVRGAAWLWD